MAKEDEVNPQDLADFASAFNEEAGPSESDDDFGMMPGEEAEEPEGGAAPVEEVVVVVEPAAGTEAGESAGNAQAQAEADAVNEQANEARETGTPPTKGEQEAAAQAGKDAAPADADEDPLADVPAEDKQKAKSWMGRLKKIEEDLMRQRAELEARMKGAPAQPAAQEQEPAGETATPDSEQLEQAAVQASKDGNQEMADAVQQAAEQVESGKISPQEARARLEADFGEEFTMLLSAAFGSDKPAAPVVDDGTKQEIEALKNEMQRRHFEDIYDAHPDFMEIHKTPEFKAYLEAHPEAAKIAEQGSARQINKMLTEYKKTIAPPEPPPPDPQQEVDADAAGAVAKSRGMRLPDKPQPAQDQDFEKAWDQF